MVELKSRYTPGKSTFGHFLNTPHSGTTNKKRAIFSYVSEGAGKSPN